MTISAVHDVGVVDTVTVGASLGIAVAQLSFQFQGISAVLQSGEGDLVRNVLEGFEVEVVELHDGAVGGLTEGEGGAWNLTGGFCQVGYSIICARTVIIGGNTEVLHEVRHVIFGNGLFAVLQLITHIHFFAIPSVFSGVAEVGVEIGGSILSEIDGVA